MLPKIKAPIFEYTLPLSKLKIRYRPYTVKEEKILLIAAQSTDPKDTAIAVKQVLNNCVLNEGFDVENMELFDLEILITLLRSVSTSNEIELKYRDVEDNKSYDFKVNFDDIIENSIKESKILSNVIQLTDELGIKMKPLTLDIALSGDLAGLDDPDKMYDVLALMVDCVFDAEEVYKLSDASKEDITEFFDSFTTEASHKVMDYIASMPTLRHKITYTNSKGTEREIVLEGLSDFF